ncbi:MAG: hypothetical protein M0006_00270 [Magnetospirillum sp.]|nr:hypothetical protein [Magnetospirillum sp.]
MRRVIRPILIAAAVFMAWMPAKGAEPAGDTFYKMDKIVLEMWDDQGLFHNVFLDLVVVFPRPSHLSKRASDKITQALQSLPYEDLLKPEATATIKSTALDIVHREPGGETAKEVLIARLFFN